VVEPQREHVNPPRSWPARSSLCLDCRTALPDGAACPNGAHRTTSLRDPWTREALLTTVWGAKPLRARLREAARVGAVGGTGGSLVNNCAGWDIDDGHVLLVLVVLFSVIFLGWLIIRSIDGRLQRRRRRLRARGAARTPRALPSTGRTGTIIARDEPLADPLEARPCIAFGIAITQDRGRQTMLRDGATIGFDVALDSGERARIPAGTCAIDLSAGTAHRLPHDSPAIDHYLETLDPFHGRLDDLDPFPHDGLELAVLRPGDRVEILSPLVQIASPTAAPATYREPAPALLIPEGAIRLRPTPR
jgi:hypothetical protein